MISRPFRAVGVLVAVCAIVALSAAIWPQSVAAPARAAAAVPSSALADTSLEERWILEWRRPAGPVRIALQAGHWKANEAPAEQAPLRSNGAAAGGKQEWEVNLEIARRAARILEDSGYVVDILPTTIPPGYWADLFIAIHADDGDRGSSGYRSAPPRRDRTGRAAEFASLLDYIYGEETGLPYYGLITRRMRGYYAFNHERYRHALHPMTVGVILETGFLSSPRDRRVIVENQDLAARGIARAVTTFISPIPPAPQPRVVAAPWPEPIRTTLGED